MKKKIRRIAIFLCLALLGASLSGCLVPRGNGDWTNVPTEAPETEPPTVLPETDPPTVEPETDPPTEAPQTEPPTDPPETDPQTDPPETEPPVITKTEVRLDPSWQFAGFSVIHSGAAVLYRTNRSNGIVIGVNAGHGTRGGEKQKTYCHPDKTPKVTGGTTAAGATMAFAVSGGMTFRDGTEERTVTLQTARILRDKLLEAGFDVLMLRDDTDVQLDNVARTVICNNMADCHISLHWDSDSKNFDKGVYYMSVPDGLKVLQNVEYHWEVSESLGERLLDGLRKKDVLIYKTGSADMDLTQTAYSWVPSVDIELGNQCSDHSDQRLEEIAEGLLLGIRAYFRK